MTDKRLTVSVGREPTYLLECEGEVVANDKLATDVYVTAIYRLSEGHVLYDSERPTFGEWSGKAPDLELELQCQNLLYEELRLRRAERAGIRRLRP